MLIALLMIPVLPAAGTHAAEAGIVTGDNVNVRDESSLSGDVLGQLNRGDEVHIHQAEGSWVEITFDGDRAFVHSDFVQRKTNDQASSDNQEEIGIRVNGAPLALDDIVPYEEQVPGGTRVLVPFRAISESMGIGVRWDQANWFVHAEHGDVTLRFDMQERRTFINGQREALDGEPKLITEQVAGESITRTMIPLRFFAETFGAEVFWDSDNRRVVINQLEPDEETEEAGEEETGNVDPGDQEDLPDEEVASARLTGVVDVATELNMREGPGTTHGVVTRLADEQLVEIDGFEAHWARVRTASDDVGYVHSGYLHIKEHEEPFFQLGAPDVTEDPHRTTMRFPKRGSFDHSINLIETSAGVALASGNISLETTSFSGAGFGSANVRDGFVDLFIDSSYTHVVRDHRNELILDLLPKGLEGKRIFLDAGHGGRDPGGVGNGLREKDIVLDVSLRAQELLEAAGAEVIMTRSTDVFFELDERVRLANRAEADLFVSVHANTMGAGNTSANGSETFWNDAYSPAGSERIAQLMQEEMVAKLGTHDRGVFSHRAFRVIRHTEMPSTLIELGFLTNAADADILRSSEGIENSAQAIFDAVKRYYD